jgi:predicted GTPase
VDADLFVWIVNGESTMMVREKEFFRKVAKKMARPNILVVVNR